MFRVVLLSQWKWSRLIVLPATVAAFAMPVLSLQAAGGPQPANARELLAALEQWGQWFKILAAGVGLLLAITAWSRDNRGRHVYALALPVPRWRYVLYRFGAGLVLQVPVVVALVLGGLCATLLATLPNGLHGYPFALAWRFALAVLLAYALFFAISSGTTKTAAVVLIVGLALGGTELLSVATDLDIPVMKWVMQAVLAWQGPFALFGGRWMLVDV